MAKQGLNLNTIGRDIVCRDLSLKPSSTFQMNLMKEHEENKLKENSIIKELREEITHLKKWKESAILETVDKDRQAKCIID